MKISSIFVAFLENMNFNANEQVRIELDLSTQSKKGRSYLLKGGLDSPGGLGTVWGLGDSGGLRGAIQARL